MNSVVAQGQTCFTNEGPQLRLVATNSKGLSTHEISPLQREKTNVVELRILLLLKHCSLVGQIEIC